MDDARVHLGHWVRSVIEQMDSTRLDGTPRLRIAELSLLSSPPLQKDFMIHGRPDGNLLLSAGMHLVRNQRKRCYSALEEQIQTEHISASLIFQSRLYILECQFTYLDNDAS